MATSCPWQPRFTSSIWLHFVNTEAGVLKSELIKHTRLMEDRAASSRPQKEEDPQTWQLTVLANLSLAPGCVYQWSSSQRLSPGFSSVPAAGLGSPQSATCLSTYLFTHLDLVLHLTSRSYNPTASCCSLQLGLFISPPAALSASASSEPALIS